MGDIEELKELVAQQARDIASLIAELAKMRVHVPDEDAAAAVSSRSSQWWWCKT